MEVICKESPIPVVSRSCFFLKSTGERLDKANGNIIYKINWETHGLYCTVTTEMAPNLAEYLASTVFLFGRILPLNMVKACVVSLKVVINLPVGLICQYAYLGKHE